MELKLLLGPRLALIASFVPPGARVADIGTDHALLPIHLLQSGISPRAVAVEKAAGPLQAARRAVARAGLETVCAVRAGNGFGPLEPGEVDTAVIAGMGGQTITAVLDAAPAGVLEAVSRLILQPMNRASTLRAWLYDHGWHLADEELVDEAGRLYEILVAEPGVDRMPEEPLLEVGPVLWARKHPLLRRHLAELIDNHTKILEGLKCGRTAEAQAACVRTNVKLERLKEMIACL